MTTTKSKSIRNTLAPDFKENQEADSEYKARDVHGNKLFSYMVL